MSLIREFIGWQNRPFQGGISVKNPDGTVQVLAGTYEINLYRHPSATPFATGTVGGGQLTVNGAAGTIDFLFATALMTASPGYGSAEIVDTSVAGGRVLNVIPLRLLPQGSPHQPEYNERLVLQSNSATILVEPIDTGGVVIAEGGYVDVTVSGLGLTWTINDNVVNNAKLADMAAGTIKANITGALADPVDVTRAAFVPWLDIQASEIEVTPSGGIAATTVADALAELDNEKLDKAGGTITGNLTVTGNITHNGATYIVNATTVTYDDILLVIGGDTAPVADDAKDRGLEFRWHDGATAKLGFFGFDRSSQEFAFIPDATDTADVISGTVGTIRGALNGNAATASQWATGRTITTTGDVTGVSAAWTGSGNISFALTIDPNKVTNAKLAQMAAGTLKGNNTAGLANAIDLTATEVTAMLNVATTGLKGLMSDADKTKLNGIATGATANSSDATLLARGNHTGDQPASTISDFAEAVDDRVAGLLVAGTNITLTYDDPGGGITIDASIGGSGISDGDFGDIIVSGSGTVMSLDSDTVGFDELKGEVLQSYNAALGADVQLSTANTFFDGPSLASLPAGTYLVMAHAQFQKTTTTAGQVTARITDGTNHYASQNIYHASVNNITLGFKMATIVTLGSTATLTLQMASTVGIANNLMKAASPNNGSGNNATQISAIRIA